MKKLQAIIASVVLLAPGLLRAQMELNSQKPSITTSVDEYFKIDREVIHLHLNKSTFLTGETIWFKGYITEKKSATPYGATVNANVQLLNETGKVLSSALLYSENSTFDGYMQIDDALPTGTYFVQTYTNFMNNFTEDESSIFKIAIINPSENKILNPKNVHFESAEMELYPESGTFLQGVSNTFGVKIADCNDNGIAVSGINVEDAAGTIITQFNTDNSGYGKFDLNALPGKIYSVTYSIAGRKLTKMLPIAQPTGVTFSVNNYAIASKTVIKIKTNSESLKQFANDSLAIVLQRPAMSAIIPFKFNPAATEHTVVIPAEEIAEGLTTIFLIDKNQNKVGERIIYTPGPAHSATAISVLEKRRDSIVFSGLSPLKLGAVSISVLPAETLSDTEAKSIHATMLFDNALSSSIKDASYFVTNPDRRKRFELDNILLTKTSKYKWGNLKQNQPVAIKFPFDNGLTIKGTVNGPGSNSNDFRVRLNSRIEGDKFATLNSNNEFYFENLIAVDSSRIHFSLLRKQKSAPLKMYSQLLNANRRFVKTFSPRTRVCTIFAADTYEFPKLQDAIELDNITVKSVVKKDTLSNMGRFGNSMSKGYKITDDVATNYIDVLSFLQAHGYNVSNIGADVTITNQGSRSLRGSNSPSIFMDDAPFDNLSLLRGYSMKDIDEIFINKRGYGGGSSGGNGIIRIYTKKVRSGSSNIAIQSQSLLVQNGFQRWREFENPKYESVHNAGYRNFGTINWQPNIDTDSSGHFKFAIPNLYQKSVKLHIEGISSDGKLISEVLVVELQ